MRLSEKDLELFFRLMFTLQYYVNEAKGIIENVSGFDDYMRRPLSEKKKVRDFLFENIDIIDEFTEDNAHIFNQDEIEILRSWKHFISGSFIIERILSKYAVFIGGDKVYAVLALNDSFSDILGEESVPVYVKTVLLPFKGQIIYDGILEPHGLSFGGRIRSVIKDSYMKAKMRGTIVHDLLAPPEVNKLPVQKIEMELNKLIAELQSIAQNLESSRLSAIEANRIMNHLKATVEYVDQRINSHDPDDQEIAYKQLRKMKQSITRFDKS